MAIHPPAHERYATEIDDLVRTWHGVPLGTREPGGAACRSWPDFLAVACGLPPVAVTFGVQQTYLGYVRGWCVRVARTGEELCFLALTDGE